MCVEQLRESSSGSFVGVTNPPSHSADLARIDPIKYYTSEKPDPQELPSLSVPDLPVVLPVQFPRARETDAAAASDLRTLGSH